MPVEVSVGDILDKVSILEIKKVRITNKEKQTEIEKELSCLSMANSYIKKYEVWYSLLKYVNERIWDLTDYLKSLPEVNIEYAIISSKIMDFNQRRFRMKNVINYSESGSLREQKSYNETMAFIDNVDIYECLPEIVYAAMCYDIVYLKTPNSIFTTPNFRYTESPIPPTLIVIPQDERVYCEFPTIRYVSGGMLGDFIHQLSIIKETYLQTGKKGVLYIGNVGDKFRRGIQGTYADIREIICQQPYIVSFKIHEGEPFDINLSAWRHTQNLYTYSWAQIFQNKYGVPWGTHPWITANADSSYEQSVIISLSSVRPCLDLDFAYIISKLPGVPVFLITEDGQESYILEKTRLSSIKTIRCVTFNELVNVIAGCKMFVGALSMPLALADAMGKNRIALMTNSDDSKIAMRTNKPYIMTMSDALKIFGA
jgi:hypothetical protein